MREHPEWWAAVKIIFNLYNLPRIIGQKLNSQPARKFQVSGYIQGAQNFWALKKKSSTFLRYPKLSGHIKIPKCPKHLSRNEIIFNLIVF
jgi:hypothetical protein